MTVTRGCLYLTADAIGESTGGGIVTHHELEALRTIACDSSSVEVWSFPDAPRPWGADEWSAKRLRDRPGYAPTLAHAYSGTFTETIALLRARGTVVTYTCAAHEIDVSRAEHERLGIPFDYPHLTDPAHWARYVGGYRLATQVIAPSYYSRRILESYGIQRIHVISHGTEIPAVAAPLPARFAVAYLGQPGADKGVTYLLDAWEQLGWDDVVLTIAGGNTEHLLPYVRRMTRGLVHLAGHVSDPSIIYNQCALYVQPSASEGFGIPVIEAMAHGRIASCSVGAGAHEHSVSDFHARDASAIANAIAHHRLRFDTDHAEYERVSQRARDRVLGLSWTSVRRSYVALWRHLLG